MTRCKFTCQSVRKFKAWGENRFLFEAEFNAVQSGSEENKKFFDATPSANLKLATYKEDIFEPGKEYYIDITQA